MPELGWGATGCGHAAVRCNPPASRSVYLLAGWLAGLGFGSVVQAGNPRLGSDGYLPSGSSSVRSRGGGVGVVECDSDGKREREREREKERKNTHTHTHTHKRAARRAGAETTQTTPMCNQTYAALSLCRIDAIRYPLALYALITCACRWTHSSYQDQDNKTSQGCTRSLSTWPTLSAR